MKPVSRPGRLTPLAFAVLCTACGGGGSSGSDNVTGIDGSGSPVYAAGPITGFGSILMNGRRYIVNSDTAITVDSTSTLQSSLQVGQYVVIVSNGTDSDGNPIAGQVRSDTLVEGPITAIDVDNNQFTVLNQTITIGDQTVFDDDIAGKAITGLAVDDVVEITGAFSSSGTVLATRVELDDDNDESKLVGTISDLDVSGRSFTINGQLVSYAGADLDDIPGGSLSDGDLVKVEGTLNADTLEASEVEGFDDLFEGIDDDDDVEINGPITRFSSATDFDVNGVPVTTDSGTEYEDGSADQLALGVVVEVEGEWRNGKLLAEEIEFEEEETIKINGPLGAVNATNASQNQGTITLFGVTLTTTESTYFEDDSDLDVSDFGFDDLRVGDYVEIEGYVSAGNAFIVSSLERDDDSNDAIFQGPLSASSLPDSITILDTIIDVSGIDTAVLNGVAAGTVVKVNGNVVGGDFVAAQVELEDEGDDD